jgi:hypothetical protein
MTTLNRYGIRWTAPQTPISVPMDDGYWTPYHSAQARIDELEAENARLRAAFDVVMAKLRAERTAREQEIAILNDDVLRAGEVINMLKEQLKQAEADLSANLARKVDAGLRAGKILGPDYDGVSMEQVATELVQMKAENARLKAERDYWAHLERSAKEVESWPAWKRGEQSVSLTPEAERGIARLRMQVEAGPVPCSIDDCDDYEEHQAIHAEKAAVLALIDTLRGGTR